MKKLILLLVILISSFTYGQEQVIKHIEATTAQRDALSDPSGKHWLIHNVTTGEFEYWDGDSWEVVLTSYTETDPIFSLWDKDLADLTGSLLQFPSTTGRKINLYSDVYSIGVESGQLRIASNQDISFYTGGYDDGDERALLSEVGTFKVPYRIQTPILYFPDDILKIQPYANDDVEVFSDTDVGNDEAGKIFKVWRRAAEGNDYIRFYITSSKTGMIHASADLTLQGQQTFTINSVTKDIIFKLGDNAGSKKVYIKDSDGVDVASIDSDGSLVADKIYLNDSGTDYFGWSSGDNCFMVNSDFDIRGVLYVGDISGAGFTGTTIDATDYIETPIIRNTDGNTLTVQDNLDIVGDVTLSGTVDDVDIAVLNSSVSNVDNTSDDNKPISLATQSALDSKAPLNNPHFTGNVGIGIDLANDELHIVSDSPRIILEESDAGSSEKVWMIEVSNEEFVLKTASDLYTATQSIIKASNRGGTSIGLVSVPNSDFAIGTSTPETSAALEIKSTSGALLLPRMATSQRDNLTAVNGMVIYNTTINAFNFYENGSWVVK